MTRLLPRQQSSKGHSTTRSVTYITFSHGIMGPAVYWKPRTALFGRSAGCVAAV